jgi:predicted RNA-binding protein with PIN domain
MALIIDGYNLLHASDIFGSAVGAETALHASRQALLAFLAKSINARTRAETTIVFDAAGAPPGLPSMQQHEAMTVHFARRHADADELIEEIIEAHPAPRSLTVISGDHRLQRAARRRGATYIDSDRWYADLKSSRSAANIAARGLAKPSDKVPPEQVEYWLQQFTAAEKPARRPQEGSTKTSGAEHAPTESIFPPGYAEDLLDGDD